MSLFDSIENPVGDGGQSDRVADIRGAFASDAITQDEYQDLMNDEKVTANYLRLKRVAMGVLLATIGFFILW